MAFDCPDDVRAALAAAKLRASSCTEITALRLSGHARATYRVTTTRGGPVKVRRLATVLAARQLVAARSRTPDAFVPVLARCGQVLVEPWVEGRPLPARPARTHIAEAAALLAMLHDTPAAPRWLRTAPWRRRAEAHLRTLREHGELQPRDAARLRAQLRADDPGTARRVIGHFDFCAENMLLTGDGHLRVIDNERIGPGPAAFDLARVRYRWPLTGRAWTRFGDAYLRAGGDRGALTSPHFWTIVVLAQSAVMRLASTPRERVRPIAALRRLARLGVASRA